MSAIDVNVIEGVPRSGVFTSDQGLISIDDYELITVTRANLRYTNGVGVYEETGRQWGTTFAGSPRCTISISRAFVNFSEAKLAMGAIYGADLGGGSIYNPGSKPLTAAIFKKLLGLDLTKNKIPYNSAGVRRNSYPPTVKVILEVNRDNIAGDKTTSRDSNDPTAKNYRHKFTCYNGKIGNVSISYNARGEITSGPIEILGTEFSWEIVE